VLRGAARPQRGARARQGPGAAACCGAAGTYAILRPEDSARILDKHLDEIAEADLDVIAVVNPGCYRQLKQGVKRRKLRTKVLHLAELLAGAR
jgi:glycolate oxidase iron-sulfur subunit